MLEKIFIFIQGSATLLFLQFFDAGLLPIADLGIKAVVATFTCYALYKQSKKKAK